jgi:predicted RNase H-like nuclease (RuvC/YqgF family)
MPRLETFAIQRIDTLVREQVSDSNYQVLQENMDKFLNNVYWDNKQARFELAKAVDQGKVEIHEVRDVAIADLEDCALQHEEDLERKIEEEKSCALEYVAEQTQVLLEKAMLLGEKSGAHKLEQPNSS